MELSVHLCAVFYPIMELHHLRANCFLGRFLSAIHLLAADVGLVDIFW